MSRHHFTQTQPLFVALPATEGMAERWLNRKNPRRSWADEGQTFGEYAAEALPDWSEPEFTGTTTEHGRCGIDCLACAAEQVTIIRDNVRFETLLLTPYTEDDDAPTNPMTAPLPLTRTVYKTVENMGDHRLAQRHSGTWRVLRNP